MRKWKKIGGGTHTEPVRPEKMPHIVVPPTQTTHRPGDIVESDEDLAVKFPNSFEEYHGDEPADVRRFGAKAPPVEVVPETEDFEPPSNPSAIEDDVRDDVTSDFEAEANLAGANVFKSERGYDVEVNGEVRNTDGVLRNKTEVKKFLKKLAKEE